VRVGKEGLWRLKSGDALPVAADPGAYAAWQARKAAALASVMAHLGDFGGLEVEARPAAEALAVPFAAAPTHLREAEGGGGGGGGAAAAAAAASAGGSVLGTGAEGQRDGGTSPRAPRRAWHARGVLVDIG
jgi:hypothetical protein